jgi:uncharacterized protein YecE (DUF72 family)
MAEVRVGTSGWRYRSWRGDFYPSGLAQRRELEYIASRMTSVEMNGSFYSLQRPTTYRRMAEQTPDGFVIAVKGGRFITHFTRLAGGEAPLANFWASGVLGLGDRLGPVLWQLPADLPFDAGRLVPFFELLPRSTEAAARLARRHDDKISGDRVLLTTDADRPVRHVLEPRHPSFGSPEAADLLRAHDIGMVLSDSPTWPCFDAVTSDLVYVRLHGHTELYASGYASRSLDRWAARAREWVDAGLDVFVYFDNDARGRAPHDAVALLARLDGAPA